MTGDLNLIFSALSDSTRRRILAMLLEEDLTVSQIARPFETSVAAVSKHLQTLAKADLVVRSRRGRTVLCSLNPDALRAAFVWMEGFGQFEDADFETVESFLSAIPEE